MPSSSSSCVQTSFADLGTPLRDTTFVVVDLETTGGAPVDAGITEIGAVKVRGGEVLGEFATLVNPGEPVPPFVAVLTGITDAMVASAPAAARRAAGVPGVRRGRGAGGAQRAVRHRVPHRRLRPYRPGLAGADGRGHGPAGACRAAARRGGQLQAGHAGASLPGRHRAEPPRSRRRPRDGRRAARPDRPGRLAGGPHRRGARDVLLPGEPGAAAEAPPRRRAARHPGGLPLPRRRRPGALRRQVRADPDPGAQLLHQQREANSHGADGRRSPSR